MVDIECTLIKNIQDKIKKLSLQGVSDSLGFRQLLSIVMVTDLIEWAESLQDTSGMEEALVKLRDKLLVCYSKNIKLCHNYSKEAVSIYTSTNIPSSNQMWDRVWDNPNEQELRQING